MYCKKQYKMTTDAESAVYITQIVPSIANTPKCIVKHNTKWPLMPKVLYISSILWGCGTGRDADQYKRQVATKMSPNPRTPVGERQQQRNNNATTTQQQRNNKTHKHGQGTLCSSVSCQGIQAKSMSSDHRIAGREASTATQRQRDNNTTTNPPKSSHSVRGTFRYWRDFSSSYLSQTSPQTYPGDLQKGPWPAEAPKWLQIKCFT